MIVVLAEYFAITYQQKYFLMSLYIYFGFVSGWILDFLYCFLSAK